MPLVLGDMGSRLAKRDGAITLQELVERGESECVYETRSP